MLKPMCTIFAYLWAFSRCYSSLAMYMALCNPMCVGKLIQRELWRAPRIKRLILALFIATSNENYGENNTQNRAKSTYMWKAIIVVALSLIRNSISIFINTTWSGIGTQSVQSRTIDQEQSSPGKPQQPQNISCMT